MSAQTSKPTGISITDGGKKVPVPAAAPPVEAGLEGQAADIAERWIRIRIQRDAPQEMIDSLKDFIVERFRTRDRELVKKLKWTIQTIREFEAHSNESGDPVGGCVKCLRLFDALLKRADELRAVLAARNEGATK